METLELIKEKDDFLFSIEKELNDLRRFSLQNIFPDSESDSEYNELINALAGKDIITSK